MASTSSEETEQKIIKEYETRKRLQPDGLNVYSGIALNLYQLRDDKKRKWKVGNIFNANKRNVLTFGKVDMDANNPNNKMESRFLVEDSTQQGNVEGRMKRVSQLRHIGILKLQLAAYNSQLSKLVSGYRVFESFSDRLVKQPVSRMAKESYLSSDQKQLISIVDFMGHPILLTPIEREIMYHEFDVAKLSDNQKKLVSEITVPSRWQTSIKACPVVSRIFIYRMDQQQYDIQVRRVPVFSFTTDAFGAIHLGAVMSSHYVERAKDHYGDRWTSYVKMDTVDLLLKVNLGRVLTRRYGLKFKNKFRAG